MSKKTRHMDTTKGYSRAAHKAVTMAVVDEDYYEEMLEDQPSGDAGQPAAGEELSRQAGATRSTGQPEEAFESAEQTQPAQTEGHRQESSNGTAPIAEGRPKKKRGLLNRMFGALRGLG